MISSTYKWSKFILLSGHSDESKARQKFNRRNIYRRKIPNLRYSLESSFAGFCTWQMSLCLLRAALSVGFFGARHAGLMCPITCMPQRWHLALLIIPVYLTCWGMQYTLNESDVISGITFGTILGCLTTAQFSLIWYAATSTRFSLSKTNLESLVGIEWT